MRAEEKLRESRFFIARLARTEGKLPRAQYYASAAVSALRAATWVLQADLRTRHGARFERWWERERLQLQAAGIGFPALRDVRNASEKKGAPLVGWSFERTYGTGPVEALLFVTSSRERPAGEVRVRWRTGVRARLPSPIQDAPEEEVSAKVGAILTEMRDLESKLRSFAPIDIGTGSPVFGLDMSLPFAEAVAGLKEYARVLARIVRKASEEFAS